MTQKGFIANTAQLSEDERIAMRKHVHIRLLFCIALKATPPRSPYRHLELCGIALEKQSMGRTPDLQKEEPSISSPPIDLIASALADFRG